VNPCGSVSVVPSILLTSVVPSHFPWANAFSQSVILSGLTTVVNQSDECIVTVTLLLVNSLQGNDVSQFAKSVDYNLFYHTNTTNQR
jgi:hypothetical protein